MDFGSGIKSIQTGTVTLVGGTGTAAITAVNGKAVVDIASCNNFGIGAAYVETVSHVWAYLSSSSEVTIKATGKFTTETIAFAVIEYY